MVHSLGGVFKTSRYTGPYAVRSSSFFVEIGAVALADISDPLSCFSSSDSSDTLYCRWVGDVKELERFPSVAKYPPRDYYVCLPSLGGW